MSPKQKYGLEIGSIGEREESILLFIGMVCLNYHRIKQVDFIIISCFEIKSVDLLRRIISEINNTLTRCNFIPGCLNRCQNSSLEDIWYFVVNEETY